MNNKWDIIYRLDDKFVSSFSPLIKIEPILKEKEIRKILDIGCGIGLHSIYLAEKGFDVVGIDISEEAIKQAKQLSKEKKVKTIFKVGNMYKLPFGKEKFDAVISLRVINHGTREQIRSAIKEIYRVLKKGGIGFITVIKILGRKKVIGQTKLNGLPVKIIEPYTYIPLEGKEKGIVHFSFNKKLLFSFLRDFEIKKFWVEEGKQKWEKYYCVLFEKI